MVVIYESDTNRWVIRTDRGFMLWRKEPFHSELKELATRQWHDGGSVILMEGDNLIVIFPKGEKSLGIVPQDQPYELFERDGPNGPVYDARLVRKGRPA
jgi:hypothetical protein